MCIKRIIKKWCFVGSLGCLFLFTGCQTSHRLKVVYPDGRPTSGALVFWNERNMLVHNDHGVVLCDTNGVCHFKSKGFTLCNILSTDHYFLYTEAKKNSEVFLDRKLSDKEFERELRCCWEIFLGVYDGTEEEITKRVYSVLYKED